MNDTPKTEEKMFCVADDGLFVVDADFARELERENNELRRLNAELEKRLTTDEWDDYNSIKHLQRENAEMRELLNEVASKLIAKNKKLEDYLKKSNTKRCK